MLKVNYAAEILEVSHFQKHSRYDYGAKLLDLALSKLGVQYEILISTSNDEFLNEARGELEVIKGNIDLHWMSTTEDRESEMIPVKIPLYRGMLGLRLLLVHKTEHQTLSNLSTLKELQRLTGGHGLHWKGLPIYAENGLPVFPHKNYENIFKLLKLKRIDYFHRGLNEIWREHDAHKKYLEVANNVMIYYPLPVYFFVTKHKPKLAEQLEKGLRLAIRDGSFKALFKNEMGKFIEKGQLSSRKLITLNNPNLPVDTPYIDTSWWMPNKFETQLNKAWSNE